MGDLTPYLKDRAEQTVVQSHVGSATLYRMLRKRYPEDAFALFSELRNTTGMDGIRSADALAIGLWKSRGMEVEGFEIKVSRSDWLRELKEPSKADEICRFCDKWWIVTSDETIVKKEEVPSTWGWLSYRNGKLSVKVNAPKLDPEKFDRGIIASLFRQIQKQSIPRSDVNIRIEEAYKQGKEEGIAIGSGAAVKYELDALKRKQDRFKEVSGIDMDEYNGEDVGEIVKLVVEHGQDSVMRYLNLFHSRAESLLRDIKEASEKLKASVKYAKETLPLKEIADEAKNG